MYIRDDLTENIYGIGEVQKEKIINILEKHCQKLINISVEKMNQDEMFSALFIISETYPLLKNVDEWEELHYQIMKRIKNLIESGEPMTLSLYGGLANIGMAVLNISKKTGYYTKFYEKLNILILENTRQYIKMLLDKSEVSTSDFDVIFGISGISYYLLEAGLNDTELFNDIIAYFNKITKITHYRNYPVPGWYVNKKNQITTRYKEYYPNGNINYSLSHGIAGPLLILSMLIEKNICENKCIDSVKNIIDEYKKTCSYRLKYHNCEWPGIVDINKYISGNYYESNERMSWCYGSIGILRSLYTASSAMNDFKLKNYVVNEIQKIANMNEKDYFLQSPILCHGYAGLIAMFLFFYKKTNQDCLVSKAKELLEILLNMYNEDSIFGFKDITYKEEQGEYIKIEEDKNGFLEGSSGIILVLESFIKNETLFDKMLLL